MPARRSRIASLLAALTFASGLALASAPAIAAPRAVTPTAARQSVWLPTGDVVSYDAAHPKDVRVRTRAASGVGHAWRAFTRKGDLYVVPLTAAPFLGSVLDPALFDVTALAKSGLPSVQVTGAGASVPGLTVAKRSGATQTGTFTHAGARTFGAAVQKAAQQHAKGLFGASSIGLASATTGPIVPQFQQQTVIFKAIGVDGKPLEEGALFYGNLDDAARGSDFAFIVDGEVRVSLPAGHFTLYSEADTFTDTSAEVRVLTQPNLRITGAPNQTVTLDFRTATARPTVSVPKAASLQDFAVDYDREWDTGGFGSSIFGDASLTVRLAPAKAPAIGTAALQTFFVLTGGSGSYVYAP